MDYGKPLLFCPYGYKDNCACINPVIETLELDASNGTIEKQHNLQCKNQRVCQMWKEQEADHV